MKAFKIILASMIITFAITSCDKVEAPYKEEIEKPDTEKKVLLEDYTGQKCVNCPAAHDIAHDLMEAYEDNLIVVAVHAGFFATPSGPPFEYDFRTEAGTEYESFFSVQTYPTGTVNRTNTGGNYLVDKDAWGTEVAKQFEAPHLVNLELSASISGDKLSGTVDLDFIEGVDFQTNLQIWITEDSIVKPQVVPGGYEEDYVHMHVLRGAINGSWGEALPSSSYAAEDTESFSFSNYQLGSDWVAKDLSIVVFLFNQDSKEVLQVEKLKVIE